MTASAGNIFYPHPGNASSNLFWMTFSVRDVMLHGSAFHLSFRTDSWGPIAHFWCPTGPFAFHPIHAAGFYDEDPGQKYMISSYRHKSLRGSVSERRLIIGRLREHSTKLFYAFEITACRSSCRSLSVQVCVCVISINRVSRLL
ncbi:hypothetical protein EV363DRAFT_1169845 [Boletus edulis]|nr:hypothetical protein EV363DRAFT_1169845 [Boletus edulis]